MSTTHENYSAREIKEKKNEKENEGNENFLIVSFARNAVLVVSGFVTIGTLFDVGVWYYVKDVKIFDEEIELEDIAEEPGETH